MYHGNSNNDLLLIGERLQGEVLDSAPVYHSAHSVVKAMRGVFPSSILRALLYILVALHCNICMLSS
jgi:hypothetical protein